MASKTKKVAVNGTEYTLQLPAPRWIVKLQGLAASDDPDRFEKFVDMILENVVIEPQVKIEDFDGEGQHGGIAQLNELVRQARLFLFSQTPA